MNLVQLECGREGSAGVAVWEAGKQLHWELQNDGECLGHHPGPVSGGAITKKPFLGTRKIFQILTLCYESHMIQGTNTEEHPSGTQLLGFSSFHQIEVGGGGGRLLDKLPWIYFSSFILYYIGLEHNSMSRQHDSPHI